MPLACRSPAQAKPGPTLPTMQDGQALNTLAWPSWWVNVPAWNQAWAHTHPNIPTAELTDYQPKDDFIKTTYDISLDSQISLLPRGFSPLDGA